MLKAQIRYSFDNRNFKGDHKGFHNGGLYILGDQSNRYRGVLPISGVLVTGNLILCGSLFFNQCYRPVRQFHHQRVNEEGSAGAGKGERQV